MKKKTLLYFGSFNPVHAGHMVVANFAAVSGVADMLWFVVSPQNPFKPAHTAVSPAHRLEMVRIAIESSGLRRLAAACDVELRLPTPSYTIQTLEALWKEHPDRDFSILMGGDNFAAIRQWKEAERILEKCPVYVYDRPGHPAKIPPDLHNINRIPDAPSLDISSSRLREMLAEGKYIPALLPHGVYNYIEKHGLYRIELPH